MLFRLEHVVTGCWSCETAGSPAKPWRSCRTLILGQGWTSA